MNSNNDLRYVIAAFVMAVGVLLPSVVGYGWTIYVAFAYLFLNAGIMVIAAGILLNPDAFPQRDKFKNVYRNYLLQFFVNMLTALFLYKIYVDGFMFLAGFFAFMLTISTISNIFAALANIRNDE